ncbi:MAG: extracellular solute-binding protein [Tagaea sp.]|nr:extracellular solute-binding protein [Tagaea sp.]
MLTRRDAILGTAGLAGALSLPAFAQQQQRVTIVSHAVHRNVATTGQSGDVTASWAAANNATLEWLTFGIDAANERALREASLSEAGIQLAFVLNGHLSPQSARLFEDVREWQARDPIPGFDEVPSALLATHTYEGTLRAMPYRHATHGLFYNADIFAERGVAQSPRTIEEMAQIAERLSFDRPDGSRVYGFVFPMDDLACALDWIRGFGGEFITSDMRIEIDRPEAVRGVTVLRDLVRKNVLPRNITSLKVEDVITFMQQGRAAMTNTPFGRYVPFNDPRSSKFPGKILPVPLPLGVNGQPMPAKTSVWAMAIPRNARNKPLAWSLLKHLSLPESTVLAALNGNGPVRPSAYEDRRLREMLPYAAAERAALATARLITPNFPNAQRATDALSEELGLALLGRKEPQAAMTAARNRVQPLLAG